MKKIILISLALLVLVNIGIVYSQIPTHSASAVINEVMRDGILYHDPVNRFVFFDEFLKFDTVAASTDTFDLGGGLDSTGWVVVRDTSAGSVALTDSLYGVVRFNVPGGSLVDSSINTRMYWSHEIFKIQRGRDLRLKIRVMIDAQDSALGFFRAGLAPTDSLGTTAIRGTCDSLLDVSLRDFIGFYKDDEDSVLYACDWKDFVHGVGHFGDSTACVYDTTRFDSTLIANKWTNLEIYFSGDSTLDFYAGNDDNLDEWVRHTKGKAIPDDENLTFFIEYRTGANLQADVFIDYVLVEILRGDKRLKLFTYPSRR